MVDRTPKKRKSKPSPANSASAASKTFVPKSERCLVPGCGKPKSVRGMCNYCYQTAKRNILRNNTTWDELMSAGLALESHTKQGFLMEALRKYREEHGDKRPVSKRRQRSAASTN